MDRKLHLWEKAMLCALCAGLLLACRTQNERAALSSQVLRVHVIAASDEPEEQEQKLRVRDAVLGYLTPLLADVTDRDEAEARLYAELEGVARAAAAAADGRQVTVTLGAQDYPTRRAEGYALPAGRYESLRVILGEGEGHNWWGLLYPELTLPAVQGEGAEAAFAEDGFALIAEEEGTELRFFLLEVWDALTKRLH